MFQQPQTPEPPRLSDRIAYGLCILIIWMLAVMEMVRGWPF
ncbi:hypothetical protein [Brevundimonas sp.]|nr:hypothetical protein [Brevundimonas sp.]